MYIHTYIYIYICRFGVARVPGRKRAEQLEHAHTHTHTHTHTVKREGGGVSHPHVTT